MVCGYIYAVISPTPPYMVAEQSGESNMSSPGLFFFIGSVVVFFILLIILFVLWKFVKFPHLRALIDRVKKPSAREDFFGGNTISHFDFQTLKKATKNFHPSNLLGRGGFGPVFLAWRLYERSKLVELVDPKLRENEFPEKDVMHTILVAFLCLQPHANVRPPMSEIVARLTCKVEVGEIPMRPAFLDRKRRVQDKLSWDTISEAFPSPLRSSSPSLSQPAK
nr:probable LRR receptor-like serine/threonine-protein kinase At1g56140 [Ipomoea batatas]